MQAIVLDAFGSSDHFHQKEVPLPQPNRNELRIKVCATGLNPVDVKLRKGIYGGSCPVILGADFSGVVDEVGDLVREFSVGDEVFGMSFGACSNGSYAEYLCVPYQFVVKKPKNLSFLEAAALPVTYLTAFQALIRKGKAEQNRPFFVAGASGGVGSALLNLAKSYQLGPAFTLAGSEQSAAYLQTQFSIPSSQILFYQSLSDKEIADQLMQMNEENRFYLAFDFVGENMKKVCIDVLETFGHLVTILPETKDFPVPFWGRESTIWEKSLSVHLLFVGAAAMSKDETSWIVYKEQLLHLAHLFAEKKLKPPHVENLGTFSVETLQEAHRRLETKHTHGKLVMSHSS